MKCHYSCDGWGIRPSTASKLHALPAMCRRKSFRTTGLDASLRQIYWSLPAGRHYGQWLSAAALQTGNSRAETRQLAPELAVWLIVPPRINDKLANEISKHEQPEALLAISNCFIDSYRDHARVYTDASQTVDGKVGIGCFFVACQDNPERKLAGLWTV